MRVLLVLPALGKSVTTHLGLAQVSAVLREEGHETALLTVRRPVRRERFLRAVRDFAPGLVACTAVTHHWPRVREWIGWMQAAQPDLPVAVGGVHATVSPESVQACAGVDYVVRGEGEAPVRRLARALAGGQTPSHMPGLHVRNGTGWNETPPAAFCQDLDALPLPDRTLFAAERGGDFPVMAGRGCPFDCSYCCNHLLKAVQPGRYVRMRSAGRVLEEIARGREAQTVRRVIFEDDTFTLQKEWLRSFLPRYRREIDLPFVANARVGLLDRDTARALKDAGCDYVSIGVECGNDTLRREVLGRDMTNNQIRETFAITKEVGLATYAFYMIGFPGETLAMARETLALHEELQPEAGFQISVVYPYPHTRLWDIAQERGLLGPEGDGGPAKDSFEGGTSTLRLDSMRPDELRALYDEFERRRLESTFTDRYLASNYPWAGVPVRIASAVAGKARVVRWAKAARDRLEPALVLRRSTYEPEGAKS